MINGWAVTEKGKSLHLIQFEADPLQDDEVEVKIIASGICASDIDACKGVYPEQLYPYPIIGGHEGVGHVTQTGKLVKNLKVGSLVGLGVYRGCCNSCSYCTNGKNNLCGQKSMMFALGQKGTFSDYVRIKGQFAFAIPNGFDDPEIVGPLMCAGLTTFAPFKNHNIRPGEKVGVLGIGGLGHLAVQFAAKWGCEVYALSSSADKTESIKKLGAHHVIDMKQDPELKSIASTLNYILLTAGGATNWKVFLNALAPEGKLVVMGNPGYADIPINPLSLLMQQKYICGSAAGSSGVATDMLRFAALHKIVPQCEKFPFSEINEVMAKVKDNKVRYRAVLCHSLDKK